MQPADSSTPPGQKLSKSYAELKEQLDRSLQEKYPQACYYDQNNMLRIKDLDQLEEEYEIDDRERDGEGRGGNNAAENIKKSLRATLKSKLQERFRDFDDRYFRRYGLKSQKENFFLIFLFLHEFVALEGLPRGTVGEVIQLNKKNIVKYITNSEARMEERPTFHTKNIEEFRKYLAFNVNFSTGDRRWTEIDENIRSLFLKKKANADQAIEKVRQIVNEHEQIKNLFVDLQATEESDMVEDPLKAEEVDHDRQDVKNHH